jgi:hypothetical protein
VAQCRNQLLRAAVGWAQRALARLSRHRSMIWPGDSTRSPGSARIQ